MRAASTRADREFPVYPIGPILVHFGGDLPDEDRGWHAYACPFHGDKNKSASVNTVDHVFVCHGCEIKGNAVQVIMKKEGLAYGDARRRCEEIAGASNVAVRSESRSSGGVSGRARNRAGVRSLRRTWSRG